MNYRLQYFHLDECFENFLILTVHIGFNPHSSGISVICIFVLPLIEVRDGQVDSELGQMEYCSIECRFQEIILDALFTSTGSTVTTLVSGP